MKAKDTMEEPKVQGEGDYDAARRHRRDVERFVQQNDTEKLARAAKPETKAESEELEKAEAEGRARKAGSDRVPERSGPKGK